MGIPAHYIKDENGKFYPYAHVNAIYDNDGNILKDSPIINKFREFDSFSKFPVAGEVGIAYIDCNNNSIYRWDSKNSKYCNIGSALELGIKSTDAGRGDWTKVAYDHSKSSHAPISAQENIIENITVGGVKQTIENKTVALPQYPTTLPASDVPAWAKNPSKPTYTKNEIGLSNVPNVATNDQTPTFTQADTLENIVSGEKLTVMFGKIAKTIADFITHKADDVMHIAPAERANWNDANKEKHSHNNKSILDGITQTLIDKWNSALTALPPHSHTKSQITDMPTKVSQFTNDSGYITQDDVDTSQNHTHANKTVLDKITQVLLDNWNAAYTHMSDAVKHVTAAERASWNTVTNKVDKVSGKQLSTNDYTAAEKTKLAGIATGANNYVHLTTAGNKHIPAGGSSGQFLKWSADGTAVWAADNNTTYSTFKAATSSATGATGLVPAPAAGAQAKYLKGDGTWQTPPDTKYTHPNSGATAGTYRSVTINAQGHITAGTNPTTLSGYGITDAALKSHTHTKSQISDFPATLKNPNAITISLNGASQGAYDGSTVKNINITAANIGAATSASVNSLRQDIESLKYGVDLNGGNAFTAEVDYDIDYDGGGAFDQ